ncbi:GIY-YIG nuclease family protein [Ovoidimarina sediminis]|uniref:GIY-YIG nuclease family protein n=1 Tax=Ovoidimarina sediminis TaxID=3079856 RepID=UPI00290DCFCE|nr:GIY-YIG nuclease family protein [Rhodophyticola sp. MJ-SS7]MDU8945111.1 GIY-YIG nuclease family protein [Rhodophyticola sp. MJ-SS7]
MAYHVYILSCASNTAIYIGSTQDLPQRLEQHRSGAGGTHTAKYRIRKLVHLETYGTRAEALERERKLKRWRRAWKNDLIAAANPGWRDLSMERSFL